MVFVFICREHIINHPLVQLAIKDDMKLYKIALKKAYKPKPPIWIMNNLSLFF